MTAELRMMTTGEGVPAKTRNLRRWGPRALQGWTNLDGLFRKACGAFAVSIVGLLALVVYQLVHASTLSIERFGIGFVWEKVWDPVALKLGAATFIYGTLVTSTIALLIAVPLGIGIAIFLVEMAPRRVGSIIGFLIELLAAIPSIVYGLWGLFVLAPLVRVGLAPALRNTLGFLPLFSGESNGVGMLTAGLILAIMVLPFIAAVSRDVLAAVPQAQREGSLALGTTKWETIWNVVLPYGRVGIAGAVILALGRALGETMAVTMVIGNSPQIMASLFQPGYTMSSVIANEYAEASGPLYLSALTELGLLLFIVTFVVNGAASLLIWRLTRGPGAHA
ncbi:MAG TPA: phosphate ABC transporter permease subunit PstC [Polyangiaceae bacterium]|nr:phosphate ABC transporter permease subunit PstC [Polyangiaceae bacterium]